jgi:hypothetical protein
MYLRLLTTAGANAGSLNIVGGGSTTVTSTAAGVVTISSTNSWRDIKVNTTSNVSTSIGTNSLVFADSFGGADGSVDLMWAEVNGPTITYSI